MQWHCIKNFLSLFQVQFKKTIISLVLILSYTVGFAHNFIPHCSDVHTGENHSKVEHNHEHHNHDGHDSLIKDHSHVEHGDHFDEGLIDYLVCLLEGVQHHDHSCDAQCTPQNNVLKDSIEKSVETSKVLTAELSIHHLIKQSSAISTNMELNLTQVDLNSSSGRAPPYTCL